MEVTKRLRPWVCALPQPGWGGITLADYIAEIGRRADASGSEQEVGEVLEGLVASGHAQPAGPRMIEDPDALPVEGEDPRWELSGEGHDALVAPIDPAAGATAAEVMLELQPGVTVSSASSEVQ